MKHLKHMLALALAVFTAFVLAVPAFAASITVTQESTSGTTGNESYVAYKIFDVTKIEGEQESTTTGGGPGTASGFAYTMDANSAWVSVVQGLKDDNNNPYFTLTLSADHTLYTVALNPGNNTEAKAKEIAGKLLAAVPTLASVDKKYEFKTNEEPVTVDDGYYLITSSLGTNLILATTDIEIQEKNLYITDDKVVEKASVTIGEDATYYIKVALPVSTDVTKKVTVHDKLDEVLKFNNDVKVYVGDTDPGSTAADYKELTYTDLTGEYVVKTTGLTDQCTFEIEITTTNLAGKYIVFKYTAELTSAAAADTSYFNEEYATYSEYTTASHKPEVQTYDFEFTKTDGASRLDGAKFELYAAWDNTAGTPSGDPIKFLKNETNYKKADRDDTGTVTEIVVNSKTDQNATNIAGLGGADNTNGTNYYLVETQAPSGYNKLTAPIICNVKDDGTMTFSLNGTTLDSPHNAFNVVNQSGTELPSTGGMGTTILYVIGGALIVGGCVALVTKKRLANLEK